MSKPNRHPPAPQPPNQSSPKVPVFKEPMPPNFPPKLFPLCKLEDLYYFRLMPWGKERYMHADVLKSLHEGRGYNYWGWWPLLAFPIPHAVLDSQAKEENQDQDTSTSKKSSEDSCKSPGKTSEGSSKPLGKSRLLMIQLVKDERGGRRLSYAVKLLHKLGSKGIIKIIEESLFETLTRRHLYQFLLSLHAVLAVPRVEDDDSAKKIVQDLLNGYWKGEDTAMLNAIALNFELTGDCTARSRIVEINVGWAPEREEDPKTKVVTEKPADFTKPVEVDRTLTGSHFATGIQLAERGEPMWPETDESVSAREKLRERFERGASNIPLGNLRAPNISRRNQQDSSSTFYPAQHQPEPSSTRSNQRPSYQDSTGYYSSGRVQSGRPSFNDFEDDEYIDELYDRDRPRERLQATSRYRTSSRNDRDDIRGDSFGLAGRETVRTAFRRGNHVGDNDYAEDPYFHSGDEESHDPRDRHSGGRHAPHTFTRDDRDDPYYPDHRPAGRPLDVGSDGYAYVDDRYAGGRDENLRRARDTHVRTRDRDHSPERPVRSGAHHVSRTSTRDDGGDPHYRQPTSRGGQRTTDYYEYYESPSDALPDYVAERIRVHREDVGFGDKGDFVVRERRR